MKKFYNFIAKDNAVHELYVYGEIVGGSEKWCEDDVTFLDFKECIEKIPDGATLDLYINSPGGSVFATQSILSILDRAKARGITINGYIDGLGASCASWLACACDNIYIYNHSVLMLHKPMTFSFGNADNLAKTGQDYIKHKTEVEMALNQLGNTTMDTSGNIIDANGNIIISADEVTTAVDGTKTAMLELNGTPCQVQVNENGSLSLLDNIRNKANSLPPEKVIKVRVDSSGLSALNGYYTGTASAKEGFANVNENGWELWENNSRSVVNLSDGMAYVPAGTKITNHMNSVKTMEASVKQEVSNQVAGAVREAIRGLSAEMKSALANNGKASNVTFNNNYEVTNKTEFDVKSNMETMAYRQKQQLRRAGVI